MCLNCSSLASSKNHQENKHDKNLDLILPVLATVTGDIERKFCGVATLQHESQKLALEQGVRLPYRLKADAM